MKFLVFYINTFHSVIQDHKNPFWTVDRLLMSISERGKAEPNYIEVDENFPKSKFLFCRL